MWMVVSSFLVWVNILHPLSSFFPIVYYYLFGNDGSETLDYIVFHCSLSNIFWTHFKKFFFTLTKKLEFSAFKMLYKAL